MNEVSHSVVTWEAFAKPVTSTKIIVRQYIDQLCENYLLTDVECYDLSKQRNAPRKPRKLYWIDPFIPQSVTLDEVAKPLDDASMVEAIVAFELVRKYEKNIWEGLNQLRHIYLWRDSRGNEVDSLVVEREKTTAIEVKRQNQISEWDVKVINKTFGKGILLTKDMFAKYGNVEVMPVYWFLK